MTAALQSATHAAAAVGTASVNAPLVEDDVQMVVSVQISKRLHAQLFADIAGAKKRDRAERLRWLCLHGLIAERQALPQAERECEVTPTENHEFTSATPRFTTRVQPRAFTHRGSNPSGTGADDARSVVSHPEIDGLLF